MEYATLLVVISPSRSAENTVTAVHLAISIAREFDYTVLLVELNFVNPSFAKFFGIEQPLGVTGHLLRDQPLPEILMSPGTNWLAVISAGLPVDNSAEMLSSRQMSRVVEDLKRYDDYRVVLFDLPPVLSTNDVMTFSQFADCALFVVDEGDIRVSEVRRTLDYLGSTNFARDGAQPFGTPRQRRVTAPRSTGRSFSPAESRLAGRIYPLVRRPLCCFLPSTISNAARASIAGVKACIQGGSLNPRGQFMYQSLVAHQQLWQPLGTRLTFCG